MKASFASKSLLVALATSVLVSCGSTSGIKPSPGVNPGSHRYGKVIVRDFNSALTAPETRMKVETARKTFADQIQGSIQKTGVFRSVARGGKPDADTLVIDGTITRYEDGNAALRLLIGLGAGSSYFDATVRFRDGATLQELGTIKVDKNSWVLGGMLAATQTADDYMPGAAKKVASEAKAFAGTTP